MKKTGGTNDMEKIATVFGVLIAVVVSLAVALNSCVRVSRGPDRPSKGIVVHWLTR